MPASDSGNQGKGGTFQVDLSTGPLGGTSQPPATTAVHIGGLAPSATSNKTGWRASVTVAVHDASHLAYSGATVTGTWSGGYSGTSSCTTAGGQCAVATGNINKRKTSATFTVTAIAGPSLAYQPAGNHATAVTVNRPQ